MKAHRPAEWWRGLAVQFIRFCSLALDFPWVLVAKSFTGYKLYHILQLYWYLVLDEMLPNVSRPDCEFLEKPRQQLQKTKKGRTWIILSKLILIRLKLILSTLTESKQIGLTFWQRWRMRCQSQSARDLASRLVDWNDWCIKKDFFVVSLFAKELGRNKKHRAYSHCTGTLGAR